MGGTLDICKNRLLELGIVPVHAQQKKGPFAAAIIEIEAVRPDGSGSRYVYKEPPADRKFEIELFQALGGNISEWAPKVIACFTDDPKALLTEYAGEPVLNQYRTSEREEQKRWLRKIVRRLARLHAATAPHASGWLKSGVLQPYPFSMQWPEWAGNQLLRLHERRFPLDTVAFHKETMAIAESFYPYYAPSLRCPLVLTHGDMHLGNIVVDERRLTFIDWEWSNAATPVRDIAILVQDVEDDELADYALRMYIEELLSHGYESGAGDLMHDYYRSLLDNTIMMAAWDIELFFMGEKSEQELARSLTVKRMRIKSSWERICAPAPGNLLE
ncbi:phosphotransferase family protein [Paenibacillus alkalitolerans]|uniref:phosphotransferase family protein n=1 Tax=Paenibacillus alkalitolerans TaxID=2799335 RepID=UPI0018F4A53E|nr:aminoglycoside phosphotransferase family protein [Paenibacillus alkalitolerans]